MIKPVTICSYCHVDHGPDPNNKFLGWGFYDGDMKIFVCWNCHDAHYAAKSKTEFHDLYTEFPAYYNVPNKEGVSNE